MGYGLLRSFRKSSHKVRLIGTDIFHDAVGQAWADTFVQAPLTSSENYLDWLEQTIKENKVDLLIPGIEQDVHCYTWQRAFFERIQTAVALNRHELIVQTQDKWLMDQELVRIQSPVRIPTVKEGSFAELVELFGLPFILKPRRSYASKGFMRICSEKDFAPFKAKLGEEYIAQPQVGSDGEEYTVGAFGDGAGKVSALIAMRRTLGSDGATHKARIYKDARLEDEIAELFRCLKPVGPTNLQFRRDENGWKLLEINPRISSSSSIRTSFGYNEADMCLDFYHFNKEISQPAIRNGFAARFIEDYIVYDRDSF
ncbi:ATP-grasp domain-containing protein [Desulfovibrio sp. OttesenSCG-928-C14]|nr:ATP-grasp domain-containing protein [Desulfovibrio sp. OttesenSCG-928-C14]